MQPIPPHALHCPWRACLAQINDADIDNALFEMGMRCVETKHGIDLNQPAGKSCGQPLGARIKPPSRVRQHSQ
jgi:hypothetical protein